MAVRIRGRSTEHAPTATIDQWDRLVTATLREAVAYGEIDQRLTKQKAWFLNPENYDHPEWNNRKVLSVRTWHARNEAARQMMDAAEAAMRYQAGLPDGLRDGLAALVGHPLWPQAPMRWAMTAARLGTDDLFRVAAVTLMEHRAEEERDATGDGADDGDTEHGKYDAA